MNNFLIATPFARCYARRLSRGIITLAILMAPCFKASASDSAMEFLLTDGTVKSIPSANLEMTFTADSLIASDGVNSVEIPLTNLSKFYFSDSSTGIENLPVSANLYSVSDLNGIDYGHYGSLDEMRGNLPKGVYVINNGIETFKIVVK